MGVDIINHTAEVLSKYTRARKKALEAVGLQGERYAKQNITANKSVDTGTLRNSISHAQKGNAAYIGTNVEYAPYVEFGTGKYTSGGRPRTGIQGNHPGCYKKLDGRLKKIFKVAVAK